MMPIYTTLLAGGLVIGGLAGMQVLEAARRNDAAIDRQVATERQAAMEERRAERRATLERMARARQRCDRDRDRAMRRIERGGRWRQPRSCESYRRMVERARG